MTEKPKRIYETLFIINASLEDHAIDAIIEKTKEFLTSQSATINTVDKWGRKRFAYAINKKTTGYYVLIEFVHTGEVVHMLERFFHLEQEVVRHIVIKLDAKAIKSRSIPKAAPQVQGVEQ